MLSRMFVSGVLGVLSTGCAVQSTGTFIPQDYGASSAEQPARVVFMGDAITEGEGASRPALRYASLLVSNPSIFWAEAEGDDLRTLYPQLGGVLDVSDFGDSSRQVVNQQLVLVDNQLAKRVQGETLVVMTVGLDDLQDGLLSGQSTGAVIDELTANLEQVLDFYEDPERFPDGARVYLSNLYDPTDGRQEAAGCVTAWQAAVLGPAIYRVNDALFELAQERDFALVDSMGHFLGHGHNFDDPSNAFFDAQDPSLWFEDCVFPNDRGHHELRRLFLSAIDGVAL